MLESLLEFDQKVTLEINSLSTPAMDQFWQFMSDKIVWIPFYVLTVFMLYKRLGWRRALIVVLSCALAFALCDMISDSIKDAVRRLRPAWNREMISDGLNLLEGRGGKYGFISSHAADTFGFAIVSWLGFRNDGHLHAGYGTIILLWATMVSASRIFVGKHYLGDVTGGAILGIAIGFLCAWLARKAIRKFVKAPVQPSPSGSHATP